MRHLFLALTLLAPLAVSAAQPAEPQTDEVSLQAEASREIENDQLVAVLGITVQGSDPASLAEQVNREMEAALKLARQAPAVKARSLGYQTSPRYDKDGRISGWVVSQDLRLESADFSATAKLIGTLQKTLVVRSLNARLSPEARRGAEDALIQEAMKAFQGRAALVAKAAGAVGYRLGSIHIATGGGIAPPVPMAMMSARAEKAPPAVEGGTSQVAVTVSGTVRLTR